MEELAKIIEKDAVIAVEVIAAANSAPYKGEDSVQDLRTAIARISAPEVQKIVPAIASRNLYESRNNQFKALLKKLWLNSLACAYGCRAISDRLGNRDSDKIFLMGLTYKIGCVYLLKSIDDITPDNTIYDGTELMESLHEVHTSFGAAILNDFGFSREFSEVVRLHKWSSFEEGTKKEVLIVNLADKIASKIRFGFFESDADLTNVESAMALGFNEDRLEEIAKDVKDAMKDVESVFN